MIAVLRTEPVRRHHHQDVRGAELRVVCRFSAHDAAEPEISLDERRERAERGIGLGVGHRGPAEVHPAMGERRHAELRRSGMVALQIGAGGGDGTGILRVETGAAEHVGEGMQLQVPCDAGAEQVDDRQGSVRFRDA